MLRRIDPVLDFMRLLWSIEHLLQRRSKSMQAMVGVTGPQRLVLLVVSRAPGISAGELAHVLRLHPSTITGVLQRLVEKRLLVREQDSFDSRRVRLRVRDRARTLVSRRPHTVEAAVAEALRTVSEEELRGARVVLTAIVAALEDRHAAQSAAAAVKTSRRRRNRRRSLVGTTQEP